MYDPNDKTTNAEEWTYGGKLFFGVQSGPAGKGSATRGYGVEATYYYLGRANLNVRREGVRKWDRSHALSIAAVLSGQPLARFFGGSTLDGLRLFMKGGAVYKHISEYSQPGEKETGSGISWMAGGGAQYAFGSGWFARVEYEFLSRVGTDEAIDLMHTPITLSVGKVF